MRPTRLPLDKITLDGGTQVCVQLNTETIDRYAELMADDHKFDAVEVLYDGTTYWPWDGFHRVAAARKCGQTTIMAIIRPGGRKDAVKLALSANRKHGLPLTNADKINAVKVALKEFPEMSDRSIAEAVGVSHSMVGKYRAQLESIGQIGQCSTRTTSDGRQYPSHRAPQEAQPEVQVDIDDIPLDLAPKTSPEGIQADLQVLEDDDDNDEPPIQGDVDATGTPINGAIAEAFRRRSEVNKIVKAMTDARAAVLASIDEGDVLYSFLNVSAFKAEFTRAIVRLRSCRPYAVCPYCSGDGCKACRAQGWLPKFDYKAAPRDLK